MSTNDNLENSLKISLNEKLEICSNLSKWYFNIKKLFLKQLLTDSISIKLDVKKCLIPVTNEVE